MKVRPAAIQHLAKALFEVDQQGRSPRVKWEETTGWAPWLLQADSLLETLLPLIEPETLEEKRKRGMIDHEIPTGIDWGQVAERERDSLIEAVRNYQDAHGKLTSPQERQQVIDALEQAVQTAEASKILREAAEAAGP